MVAKSYIITLNNPEMGTQEFLNLLYINSKARYVVGQLEKGEMGTPHIQAYVNFSSATRPSALKRVCSRMHIEKCRSEEKSIIYCQKEETRVEGPFEFGSKPIHRNNKSDWEGIWNSAKMGKIEDIPKDILIKHYKNIKQIEKDHLKHEDATNLRGIWIHGMAGFGKSRIARMMFPEAYPKLCNKWWDGYQNQSFVIMDDVGLEHKVLGHQLKLWSDRYGCTLEVKGGAVVSRYEKFIVTSQYSIEDIWNDQETRDALNRRFKTIYLNEKIDFESDFNLNTYFN